MNKDEALKILRQYNEWRRDKNDINQHEMPNPTLLGLAIDQAIEALEQPTQEPVAWRVLLDESPEDTDWHYMTGEPWECFKQSAEPLYTHPAPSWVELTDDEIDGIWLKLFKNKHKPTHLEFAKKIIDEMKDKNVL